MKAYVEMCDTRFCDNMSTWYHEGDDVYACDTHGPPISPHGVTPPGWRRLAGAADYDNDDDS